MAMFITYFTYTQEAMVALVKNPEDRSVPVQQLVEHELGETIHGVYLEAGSNNGFAIYDVPEANLATVGTLVVNAAGHLTNLRTVALVSMPDLVPLAEQAAAIAYRAPG